MKLLYLFIALGLCSPILAMNKWRSVKSFAHKTSVATYNKSYQALQKTPWFQKTKQFFNAQQTTDSSPEKMEKIFIAIGSNQMVEAEVKITKKLSWYQHHPFKFAAWVGAGSFLTGSIFGWQVKKRLSKKKG